VNEAKNIFDPASWSLSLDPEQVMSIQNTGRNQIIRQDDFENIKWVAGLDVGYKKKHWSYGAAVLYDFPILESVESTRLQLPTMFPYLPGALAFREIPVLLEALRGLPTVPDLLLCDAHGIAHPRRFGLASHLGLLMDCAAIGCAKNRLIGEHEWVPNIRGSWSPLLDRGERIGAVLRTQEDLKPVYVSIGHKISLETAISIVLECTLQYRLPEPLRGAHLIAAGNVG
jgi:deoxyribonuclease V